IGRVGGLAVALGVGAALYSGVAVASAESGSTSASASGAAPSAGRSAHGPRSTKPAAAKATRRAAAAPAAVTVSVNPTGSGGNAPATTDTSLDLAALAYSRRASVTAASTAAAAADSGTTPVIMGPSGVPIPSDNYVTGATDLYIIPNYPVGAPAQVLFTPEGLYPITGVKSLPLNTSADQGIQILSDALSKLPDGTATTVFGYSQSAIISGLLQGGYTLKINGVTTTLNVPDNVAATTNFILVGNELNPDCGFLSRFSATEYSPAVEMPSLGLDFYGATPQAAYDTTNYTLEYDGFADFPRYPLNFLADLNAGLGIVFVHTKYVPGPNCKTYCTTAYQVQAALDLPTVLPPGSTVVQNYRFIPTENLPLLEPVRLIPIIGNPIADLVQPVLKAIVDLGYGDAAHGYASGGQPNANVLVPFGLFPAVDPLEVLGRIVNGIGEGIGAFLNDFGPSGSIARELSAITLPSLPDLTSLALPTPGDVLTGIQNLVTRVANAISYSASNLYAGVLPLADIANAILTSLPAYNLSLVIGGIKQALSGDVIGGLINAIGLPIAADVGLVTNASLVGGLVFAQAVAGLFGITVGA
ncbi:MAG: PE-PPE domain-containing protein, partial [Fluviibacter sp.]